MPRIAVIDDVDANNILLKGYLRSLGSVDLHSFTDPCAAFSWCVEYEPDLVIVDYMMPEFDGIAFIQKMRAEKRLKETPVIMVTGSESRDTLYEALHFGRTDFLRKPVDRLELVARARNMLELRAQQRDLNIANQQLFALATTDTLTGIKNRRFFLEALKHDVTDARAQGEGCCLAILDIDRFKSVNDTYGHDGGDRVLKAVTRHVSGCLRERDLLGRLGGEEFGILLPRTEWLDAILTCERLLQKLRELPIAMPSTSLFCTASVGVAKWQGTDDDIEALVNRADRALYAAKANGRDRVEVADGRSREALALVTPTSHAA